MPLHQKLPAKVVALTETIEDWSPVDKQDLMLAMTDDVGLFWKISMLEVMVRSIQTEADIYGFKSDVVAELQKVAQKLEGDYYTWANSDQARLK